MNRFTKEEIDEIRDCVDLNFVMCNDCLLEDLYIRENEVLTKQQVDEIRNDLDKKVNRLIRMKEILVKLDHISK